MNGYPSFYPRIALVAPSPGWHQAINWTNAGILLIKPLGTNFNEILIKIRAFSFYKVHTFENVVWKMAAILSRPQCVKSSFVTRLASPSNLHHTTTRPNQAGVRHTKASPSAITPVKTLFNENLIKIQSFLVVMNVSENAACQTAAILFWLQLCN